MCHPSMAPRMMPPPVYNFNCSVPIVPPGPPIPMPPPAAPIARTEPESDSGERGGTPETPPNTTSISTQTPANAVLQKTLSNPVLQTQTYPVLNYNDALSLSMWQHFIDTRQTSAKYAKKVHFRNALHMIISSVFERELSNQCLSSPPLVWLFL